jgi:hypothetical protein
MPGIQRRWGTGPGRECTFAVVHQDAQNIAAAVAEHDVHPSVTIYINKSSDARIRWHGPSLAGRGRKAASSIAPPGCHVPGFGIGLMSAARGHQVEKAVPINIPKGE